MTRYIKLFFSFLKYNLVQEMEFRQNFYIRLITQIFYVALQLIVVNTFFQYTNALGNWTKMEVFVLIGIFRLIEGAFHMFIQSNLLGLPELINRGELDLLLYKPINPLFFVSLKDHQLYEVSTFFSGFLILWYTQLIHGPNWINVISLAFFGFIVLYNIMLFFSTLAFYIPRLSALSSIWDVLSKTSRFPLDIFTKSSRAVFYMVIPLFLVATLPSQIVLGKISPAYFIIQLIGTAFVSAIVYRFWLFSLRHYSSASS